MSKFLDENGLRVFSQQLPRLKTSGLNNLVGEMCYIDDSNNVCYTFQNNKTEAMNNIALQSYNKVGSKAYGDITLSNTSSTTLYINNVDLTDLNEAFLNETLYINIYAVINYDDHGTDTNLNVFLYRYAKITSVNVNGNYITINAPLTFTDATLTEVRCVQIINHPELGDINQYNNSTAIGYYNTSQGYASFTGGSLNYAYGNYSFVGNYDNIAVQYSTAFGTGNSALGRNSFVTGKNNKANAFINNTNGLQTKTYGVASTTFGFNTIAGDSTRKGMVYSHTVKDPTAAFACGYRTKAVNKASFTANKDTIAGAKGFTVSLIQRLGTTQARFTLNSVENITVGATLRYRDYIGTVSSVSASTLRVICDGQMDDITVYEGEYVYVDGCGTIETEANAAFGLNTIADGDASFVVGKYNQPNGSLFSVGCGKLTTDDNGDEVESRKNALSVFSDGLVRVYDNLYCDRALYATYLTGNGSSITNINATNITSGKVSINRLPTGTTSSTVSLGNHSHDLILDKASSTEGGVLLSHGSTYKLSVGSSNVIFTLPGDNVGGEVDLSNYYTKQEVNNYVANELSEYYTKDETSELLQEYIYNDYDTDSTLHSICVTYSSNFDESILSDGKLTIVVED